MFKILHSINAPHILVENLLIDRFTHFGFHHRQRSIRIDTFEMFEADFIDRLRRRNMRDQLLLTQCGIFLGGDRKHLQPVGECARRCFAQRNNFRQVVEITG